MVQIDLFTLIAQIINFIVLILLLRVFLYKRIIKAMDEREKRIASRLEEVEMKKRDAEKEAESYREKERELLEKREEMLAQARKDVEAKKEELASKARSEVEESRAAWYKEVERQKNAFLAELRRRAGERIYAAARRVLQDLANDDLERQIINTFIKRLQDMEKDEKEAIKALGKKPQERVVIKSAFEIPEIMRKMVEEAVRDQVGGDVDMHFETSSRLICGIELHAQDRRISWSLNGYLEDLEEDLSRAIEQRAVEE